jgi:hypothetical protein
MTGIIKSLKINLYLMTGLGLVFAGSTIEATVSMEGFLPQIKKDLENLAAEHNKASCDRRYVLLQKYSEAALKSGKENLAPQEQKRLLAGCLDSTISDKKTADSAGASGGRPLPQIGARIPPLPTKSVPMPTDAPPPLPPRQTASKEPTDGSGAKSTVQTTAKSAADSSTDPIKTGTFKFQRDEKKDIKLYKFSKVVKGARGQDYDDTALKKILFVEGPDKTLYLWTNPEEDSRPAIDGMMKKANVLFTDNLENRVVKFKPTGKKVHLKEDNKDYELVEIISLEPAKAPPPGRPLPRAPRRAPNAERQAN